MTLNKYLRTGAAALGALAVASAANAADMYSGGMKEAPVYVPPPTWTGFYLGGHIGAAWESIGNQNYQFNDDCMGWGICRAAIVRQERYLYRRDRLDLQLRCH